ncbi:MAG: AAA family ATPase [Bacteroidia bacterium]|nr:AAA family ATPase [Bacteroidia bacterium]
MEGLDEILRIYNRRLQGTPEGFKRYLIDKIDWRDNLIAIKGAKGTGKTTMLLQHIKESFTDKDKALYISLDNLWFETHSINDLIEYHYAHGGTHLFLDEVHYSPNWKTLIKNINDDYPGLHVVYTGSSMLKIDSGVADLSRRQLPYTLHGMSFREYLLYEGLAEIEPVPFDILLSNHRRIAEDILSNGMKILPLFADYLRYGYYPFYKSVYSGFEIRLQQVVNHVLENDYPIIEGVEQSTIRKTKKMFMILAEQVPQTPNMSNLYNELETDRNQGLKMLYALEKAGLLALLSDNPKHIDKLSRPEKIFMDNSNLMYAYATNPNIGTVRETFFLSQLAVDHSVTYPAKGDFLVDGKYLFEVGGRRKSFEQIKDVADSYLAVDDTEIGHHNRIPLWMFGLLY